MPDPGLTGPILIAVPSSLDHLALVQAAAAHAMGLAGLGPKERQNAQVALEEAFANASRHAYPEGEEGRVEVEVIPTATGVDIAVRDQGRPFDPAELPAFDPTRLTEEPEARGLGVFLMRQMVDRVQFLNQGRRGMEIRLTKHRAHAAVRDGEPEHAEAGPPPAAPSRDPGAFQVRPMAPGEAGDVARCAWSSYRYTYFNEHIYLPERVRELNASGAMRSLVAVAGDGTLYGHAALVPCDLDPGLAEMAVAFIDPAYRGGGTLERLSQALIATGREAGFHGLFAHAVTTHPYSQKAVHRFGFTDTCLFLAALPPMRFTAIREGQAPRESLLHAFLPLRPPGELAIHPGPRHEAMVRRIYGELRRQAEIRDPAPPAAAESELDLHVDACGAAHVLVNRVGADAPGRVRRLLRDAVMDRLEVVFLYLPLEDPATGAVVGALEDLGCVFAGVHPGSPGRERLVLQYLITRPASPATLRLDSEHGRDLAAYVESNLR